MENTEIIKALAVLMTAPWWLPLVRLLCRDVWRASEPDGGMRAPRDPAELPGGGFGDRGRQDPALRNGLWSIGRRPIQRRASAFDRPRSGPWR